MKHGSVKQVETGILSCSVGSVIYIAIEGIKVEILL